MPRVIARFESGRKKTDVSVYGSVRNRGLASWGRNKTRKSVYFHFKREPTGIRFAQFLRITEKRMPISRENWRFIAGSKNLKKEVSTAALSGTGL